MKLGLISLGCAKNLIDSELFLGVAKKYHLEIVNKINEADILVVNTCGFIESAKQEAINTILELVDYKEKGKTIIAMGCLVERYLDELKVEIPEVDYYIPIRDYAKIDTIFEEITTSNEHHHMCYTNRVISTYPHSAYLRIADGCNNRCSYCSIPLIRGSFRSRPLDSIIEEANFLANQGIKEVTLIAQDTTRYGTDFENTSLSMLLERLALLDKFSMIRVLYLYPDEITTHLIDVMKKYNVIAKYFDIPIQHASNTILKAMNRRGTKEDIESVINEIRLAIPDAIIRTTLIVGFPGENDDDYQELKAFVKKINFEHMGIFTYSDEEDTPSHTYPNKIPQVIMDKRYQELMEIQQQIVEGFHSSLIGKKLKVIVDKYDYQKEAYATRSYMQSPEDVDGYIYVKDELLELGEYYDVVITGYSTYDLFAKIE